MNEIRNFTALVLLFLIFCLSVSAQEQEENNTFGGWEFFEVNHSFKNSNWYTTFYFEHANYQYKRLESWYARLIFGNKITSWLKTGFAYDFMQEPGYITHRAVAEVTGSLKQGNLTVSLRERYIHSWSPEVDEWGNVLRSRLKVQYTIPESPFKPYLAMEVFTWDGWKKTRHYVGTACSINEHFEIEGYYVYYTFVNKPAEHVLGIGLNIAI
ncbi:MAG: DUF2490 domain-containing protein [Bacteroides sp.]|nr:DUF2490 domain-containing protein [Bacteroides sp.]